jgi:hypothetical protein
MITTREVWPNFLIVGAPKAATTALYYYLKNIPGVYMSPMKEVYYFASHAATHEVLDVIRDKGEYLSLFKDSEGSIAIGEASPSYLWDPDAARRIHEAIPNARIVMILRDPIERAYSQYLMKTKYSDLKASFYEDLLKDYNSDPKVFGIASLYVEFGMYYEQVKRYFELFGKERVKVIIFEEFTKSPLEKVSEVLTFLGVNHDKSNIDQLQRAYSNTYSQPRSRLAYFVYAVFRWLRTKNIKTYKLLNLLPHSLTESLPEKLLYRRAQKPQMQAEAREFLRKMYYDDAVKLQKLLGRPLPWSVFQ